MVSQIFVYVNALSVLQIPGARGTVRIRVMIMVMLRLWL